MQLKLGNFKIFPSNTYLYGFVDNLCDLYQIDGQTILTNLKEEIEKVENRNEKETKESSETHLQDKEQRPLFSKRIYSNVFIITSILVSFLDSHRFYQVFF